MYPRNNASPEPIAIGAVIQISDGAVQTSGCTVRIRPIGVSEGAGAGTVAYTTDGVVMYTPTQAETNYTSFVLIASKAGCVPVAVTVVTTDAATPGRVRLDGVTHSGATVPAVTTTTNLTNLPSIPNNWLTAAGIESNAITSAKIAADAIGATQIAANAITSAKIATDAIGAAQIAANAIGAAEIADGAITSTKFAAGAINAGAIAADAITDAKVASDVTIASVTGAVGSVTGNVGGNVVGSVGSVTGAVGSVTGNVGGSVVGSVGSISGVTFPTNFSALGINASGHVSRVVLVDTTTTNTDMISAAGVRSAVGLASANLDTQLTSIKDDATDILTVANKLDSAMEVDGLVWRFTVNALENAPAGGGGGSGDASQATLLLVKAKTDLIVAGEVQFTAMVGSAGRISQPIMIGDDYLAANGRAFQWTIPARAGYVVGTSTCRFGGSNAELGTSWSVTGTVSDLGGGEWRLSFDLSKAVTGALLEGYYRWSVELISAGGTEVTEVYSGRNVEVRAKQT